jgi:hypothetical protein
MPVNIAVDHENELLLSTVRAFMDAEIFPHEDMVPTTSAARSSGVPSRRGSIRRTCPRRSAAAALASGR